MSISIKTAREIEKMRRAGELLEKVAGMHRFNCTAGTVAKLLAQGVAA